MASSEVQERKNLKKYKNIFGLLLTVYTEYDIIIDVRGREVSFLSKKRINKGEIRNEKENRKSYYRGYRVY